MSLFPTITAADWREAIARSRGYINQVSARIKQHMNTQINDGGSAFPSSERKWVGGVGIESSTSGMTLRDWFAGQALAGMLANPSLVRWRDDPANQLRPSLDIYEQREALAFKASQLADAMLAARQNSTPTNAAARPDPADRSGRAEVGTNLQDGPNVHGGAQK